MVEKTVQFGGLFFRKPSQIDWDKRRTLVCCWPIRSKAGLDRKDKIFRVQVEAEAIENQVLEEFGYTGGERNGLKEAGESAGLPGLCMRIIVTGSQQEEVKSEKTRTS